MASFAALYFPYRAVKLELEMLPIPPPDALVVEVEEEDLGGAGTGWDEVKK